MKTIISYNLDKDESQITMLPDVTLLHHKPYISVKVWFNTLPLITLMLNSNWKYMTDTCTTAASPFRLLFISFKPSTSTHLHPPTLFLDLATTRVPMRGHLIFWCEAPWHLFAWIGESPLPLIILFIEWCCCVPPSSSNSWPCGFLLNSDTCVRLLRQLNLNLV